MLFQREQTAQSNVGSIYLHGGRVWRSGEIRSENVLVQNGVIAAIGNIEAPPNIEAWELEGRLITPGFIDAEHDVRFDHLGATCPGPYLDRERRKRDMPDVGPANDSELVVAIETLIKEGVSTIAVPGAKLDVKGIRIVSAPWISSLVFERNPTKRFARTKGTPIYVSVADGDSKEKARDVTLLRGFEMLKPNLVAVGGTALRREDAEELARAEVTLVWRPVTDEYILGRTIGPEVFAVENLKLMIGGGTRQDGGRGLIAALQRADSFGYCSRRKLLTAATETARWVLQTPVGIVAEGLAADLNVWEADDFESAVFERGKEALCATIVDGRSAFRRNGCFT
ncbi:MAG: hypothetical protein P9L99_06200 [Candidatus Lernaella stagnicola]|nr:hypothetical protein [Candidatus Lernaella stagnicola]